METKDSSTQPTLNIYRIRSMSNGNSLGCISATSEDEACDLFNAGMAPYPTLDVYAELTAY